MFGARRVARRTARRTARRVSRRQSLLAPEPESTSPTEYAGHSPAGERYILLPEDSGSPPLKLSQTDAQRIQEHTGYPPEELEDHDLQQSMQELNIHSASLTPQDYNAMGMHPPAQSELGTVVVHRTHPNLISQASIEEQLKSLHNLQQSGLITEDDYNAKKKQLLGI
jgi:Short C-terminal domain